MKILTRFQSSLIKEYNRTRKLLRTRFKRKIEPAEVIAFIEESIQELTERHAKIIAQYIYKAYKTGTAEAKRELKGVEIKAAASILDMGNVGMDLSEVSQKQMNRIFHNNLGAIGNYNENLSKSLQHQYNLLLNDNKLLKSLDTNGWTPWLEGEWKKRGVAPEIIKLIKGQKTSKQMISILEMQGIRGGKHPNEVGKLLVPHINRFFGPEGVEINNIGKEVKRLIVDADGNYEWDQHKITKAYKATPRTYSRMLARNVMRQARMDAYYDSLKNSKLVDHYISVSHLDANTCANCAMMHGQTVTKGSGPQYHPNCGCDLQPVWKKDSLLASQNKPDAFYEKQRDIYFMRMDDLKRYNAKMPRGMKLKYATQLPEDAITKGIPGDIEMRRIRHEMLGNPIAIKPSIAKPKVITPEKTGIEKLKTEERATANELWKKTNKDGNEHMKITNSETIYITGKKDSVSYEVPETSFKGMHTHPNWDSPPSGRDIVNLLTTPNMRQTAAASPKRIYVAIKGEETKVVAGMYENNFIKLFRNYATDINNELLKKEKAKIGRPLAKDEITKIWRDANDETNKIFAKKYKYEYISFTRK